jgi:ABC-2 type transport system permease protein
MSTGHGRYRTIGLWGRRLFVMTRKELLQLSRDVPLTLFLVYAFTLSVYISGTGVQTQLRNASLLVHDADHSYWSRELAGRFQPPYFKVHGMLENPAEGIRALDRGRAMVLLDIPPQFGARVSAGQPVSVQLLVDTTNAPQGLSAAGYAARIAAQFGQDATASRLGGTSGAGYLPVIRSEHRVWYNPTQDERWFESISALLRMITLFAVLLPAAALVREKERGTVEQLLVAPLTPLQIMLPKVLAMTLVILGSTMVALLGIMQPAFGVPIRGSLTLYLTLTALFAFTMAGMGLFAATLTRNQAQVGMVTLLIVAPILLLSGITTPLEAMPFWVRQAMNFSPLRYFIEITYGVLLKGSGVAVLWPPITAMAVLGGAVFAFGLWRFRKQFT